MEAAPFSVRIRTPRSRFRTSQARRLSATPCRVMSRRRGTRYAPRLTSRRVDLPMLIDLRHLLRNLRRSPASAAAAVLTLSLTLGAGASIFAVVDAVLLTPPPFADPDALVTARRDPARRTRFSAPLGEVCHVRGLARACGIAGGDRSVRRDTPDAHGARCGRAGAA